jgi:short-subunit dehydrogenase
MPWSLARQMVQVNILALTRLTMLFLPEMKSRNQGHIINVGSIVGSLPSQGVAIYSATKSFIDSFTTSIYRELRGTNVHVSVVRSGAVSSEFFDHAAGRSDGRRIPLERFSVSPEIVAGRIWSLLNRPARTAYIPRSLAVVPWLELSFGWIIDRLGPLALKRQT